MGSTNILIVENQVSQLTIIRNNLKDDYSVFPDLEVDQKDFDYIMDRVAIRLNHRYNKIRRDKAIRELQDYVRNNKIDLLILDYALVGCHTGKSGVHLAAELFGARDGIKLPVIFLSGIPESAVNKTNELEFLDHYRWVEKGFAGISLKEPSYFNHFLLKQIPILIGKSLADKYLEMLDKILKDSMFREIKPELTELHKTIKDGLKLSDTIKKVITELHVMIGKSPRKSDIKKYGKE